MATDKKYFVENPLCFRCGKAPHMKLTLYCYPCYRIKRGIGKPSCTRRKTGALHLCPKCLKNERGSQPYCPKCKLDYQNATRAKKWSDRYSGNEPRRIETARAYATNLLARGKIRRGPCVFCGLPGTQFHHYDYERKTRNFESVCDLCHAHVHIFLELMLTVKRFTV